MSLKKRILVEMEKKALMLSFKIVFFCVWQMRGGNSPRGKAIRKCVNEMWEEKEGSRGIHKRRAPLPAAEKEKNLFWKMKKKPGFFWKKISFDFYVLFLET